MMKTKINDWRKNYFNVKKFMEAETKLDEIVSKIKDNELTSNDCYEIANAFGNICDYNNYNYWMRKAVIKDKKYQWLLDVGEKLIQKRKCFIYKNLTLREMNKIMEFNCLGNNFSYENAKKFVNKGDYMLGQLIGDYYKYTLKDDKTANEFYLCQFKK